MLSSFALNSINAENSCQSYTNLGVYTGDNIYKKFTEHRIPISIQLKMRPFLIKEWYQTFYDINMAMYRCQPVMPSELQDVYNKNMRLLTTLTELNDLEKLLWKATDSFRFLQTVTPQQVITYHQISNLWRFFGKSNRYKFIYDTFVYNYASLAIGKNYNIQKMITEAVVDLMREFKKVMGDYAEFYAKAIFFPALTKYNVPSSMRIKMTDYFNRTHSFGKIYGTSVHIHSNVYTENLINRTALQTEITKTIYRFEELYRKLKIPLANATHKKIDIYICVDHDDFRLATSIHKTPNTAGGVTFDMGDKIVAFVYYHRSLTTPHNFRHELLHVLSYLQKHIKHNSPDWYVEGIATYLTADNISQCYENMDNFTEIEVVNYLTDLKNCSYNDLKCVYSFGSYLTSYMMTHHPEQLRRLIVYGTFDYDIFKLGYYSPEIRDNNDRVAVDDHLTTSVSNKIYKYILNQLNSCTPMTKHDDGIFFKMKNRFYPHVLEVECPGGVYQKLSDVTTHIRNDGRMEMFYPQASFPKITTSTYETSLFYDIIIAEALKAKYGNMYSYYNKKTYPAELYCNNIYTKMDKRLLIQAGLEIAKKKRFPFPEEELSYKRIPVIYVGNVSYNVINFAKKLRYDPCLAFTYALRNFNDYEKYVYKYDENGNTFYHIMSIYKVSLNGISYPKHIKNLLNYTIDDVISFYKNINNESNVLCKSDRKTTTIFTDMPPPTTTPNSAITSDKHTTYNTTTHQPQQSDVEQSLKIAVYNNMKIILYDFLKELRVRGLKIIKDKFTSEIIGRYLPV